jgi:fatty acid desaturase
MKDLNDIGFESYEPGLPGTPDLTKLKSKQGVTWLQFRETLTPKYHIVWRDVAICYFLIILGIALSIYIETKFSLYITIPVTIISGLWIGYWFHSLSLFLHEAVHYLIHKDKKMNDLLTDLIICPFIFINTEGYRRIHWQHHTNLGTTKDTEKSYFNALSPRFILESLTGIHAVRTLLVYFSPDNHTDHKEKTLSEKIKGFDFKKALRLIVSQSIVLLILVLFGKYFTAIAWIIGIVIFWPFLGSLRQILRHRGEYTSVKVDYYKTDQGAFLRMFGDDLFSKSFGAAGFNKHMLHHWDPHVSYTRLDDMEKFMLSTELGPIIDSGRTSYKNVFFKLLKQGLGDE